MLCDSKEERRKGKERGKEGERRGEKGGFGCIDLHEFSLDFA